MAERLRIALGADLSVAGYHLPLDAHREIGNNALLCEMLGFELERPGCGEVKGRPIGVIGRDRRGRSSRRELVDAGRPSARAASRWSSRRPRAGARGSGSSAAPAPPRSTRRSGSGSTPS